MENLTLSDNKAQLSSIGPLYLSVQVSLHLRDIIRGPERCIYLCIISKHIWECMHCLREVVDEHNKEARAQHTTLRQTTCCYEVSVWTTIYFGKMYANDIACNKTPFIPVYENCAFGELFVVHLAEIIRFIRWEIWQIVNCQPDA